MEYYLFYVKLTESYIIFRQYPNLNSADLDPLLLDESFLTWQMANLFNIILSSGTRELKAANIFSLRNFLKQVLSQGLEDLLILFYVNAKHDR
jgi:hypothetical protein